MSIRHIVTTPDSIKIEANIHPRGHCEITYIRGSACKTVTVRRPSHHSVNNVGKMIKTLQKEIFCGKSMLSMQLEEFRREHPAQIDSSRNQELMSETLFTDQQLQQLMDGVQRTAASRPTVNQTIAHNILENTEAIKDEATLPDEPPAQVVEIEPSPTTEPTMPPEADASPESEIETLANEQFAQILGQKSKRKSHPDLFFDTVKGEWFCRYEDLDDPVQGSYRRLRKASNPNLDVMLAIMKRIGGQPGMRVVSEGELSSTGRMRKRK